MSNATEQAFPSPGMPYVNTETGIPHDPFAGHGWMFDPRAGLTKREHAAIQIMAGMGDIGGSSESLAKHAVKRADALLAELAKQ